MLKLKVGARKLKLAVVYALPIIGVICLYIYYKIESRYANTNDAYIKTGIIYVASEVNGKIASIDVHENEQVKKGQVLLRLEQDQYKIAVEQAEAQLLEVGESINAMKVQYIENQYKIEAAAINMKYAQKQLQRAATLVKKGATTAEQFDNAQNAFENAKINAQIIQKEQERLLIELAGDSNISVERHPKYIAALSALNEAMLDLKRTTVIAPADGIVSQISTQYVGDYAAVGTALFAIIVPQDIWVEANLKETDLTNVLPGQKVSIRVDTYPDMQFKGCVESVGVATGAVFSIIPPQNASGNWVKVVQRIPVRISIKQLDGKRLLRAGMSVEVSIDTASTSTESLR